MALPNKPKYERIATANPEVEEREVDLLIVGGGIHYTNSQYNVAYFGQKGNGFTGASLMQTSSVKLAKAGTPD
ncbi:MAG: hypothetical protein HN423_04400 [Alphaproteobacteria bacterium]|nr:hypothetical protein [Alphaproteobacteria bacterium]